MTAKNNQNMSLNESLAITEVRKGEEKAFFNGPSDHFSLPLGKEYDGRNNLGP